MGPLFMPLFQYTVCSLHHPLCWLRFYDRNDEPPIVFSLKRSLHPSSRLLPYDRNDEPPIGTFPAFLLPYDKNDRAKTGSTPKQCELVAAGDSGSHIFSDTWGVAEQPPCLNPRLLL